MKKFIYIRILLISCLAVGFTACKDDPDTGLSRSAFTESEFLDKDYPILSVGPDIINFTDDQVKTVSTISNAERGLVTAQLFFGKEDEKYVSITTPAFAPQDIEQIFSVGTKNGFSIEYQLPGYDIYFVITETVHILKTQDLPEENGLKCKRIWLSFVDPLSYKKIYMINDLCYN